MCAHIPLRRREQSHRVTKGDCPSACQNNYHFDTPGAVFSTASVCVRCDANPVYASAGFIYSYWGAPPTIPWFSLAETPADLRPNVGAGFAWEAAGVCWKCHTGSDVETGDAKLCTLIGGYGRYAQVVTVRELTPIPSNVAQFAVYYQVHSLATLFLHTLLSLWPHSFDILFGYTLWSLLTYSLVSLATLF